MAKLFGTDGVRGIANELLTPELAFRLGEAAVKFLGPKIIIGRDTRRSGNMLESALIAGITSEGGTALLAGIVPTPAVALLTRDLEAQGGVVISASHNPAEYNGIKFFNEHGMKISDTQQEAIEAFVEADEPSTTRAVGEKVGAVEVIEDAAEQYISHAVDTVEGDLEGLNVVLDVGHGASYFTSPQALRRLGANVTVLNDSFTGLDINLNCGSTHLDQLKDEVVARGADVGVAHDGDADRTLIVTNSGTELDGDQILAVCGLDLKERGLLAEDTIVSTVMSNLGFVNTMNKNGITVEQTQVGDRYVLERMREVGAVLGGEQSGHVIFLDHNTTGDGLITALNFLSVVHKSGKTFDEASHVFERYPQHLQNVKSPKNHEWNEHKVITDAIENYQSELGDSGRILVRASGTEPLVRVMVEAKDEAVAESIVSKIAKIIDEELN